MSSSHLQGYSNVLESMTPTQRSILHLLATTQVKDTKGVLFQDFFSLCKEDSDWTFIKLFFFIILF